MISPSRRTPALMAGSDGEAGDQTMSDISFKLVHSRPFIGRADDLAMTLLLSVAGLLAELVLVSAGYLA